MYGCQVPGNEIFICLGEMPATEEASVGRQRGGVGSCQHEMSCAVYVLSHARGVAAPEQEHESLAGFAEPLHGSGGECLPSASGMAAWGALIYGESGVEQEHSL